MCGGRSLWEIPVLSSQLCCDPKTALRKQSLSNKKHPTHLFSIVLEARGLKSAPRGKTKVWRGSGEPRFPASPSSGAARLGAVPPPTIKAAQGVCQSLLSPHHRLLLVKAPLPPLTRRRWLYLGPTLMVRDSLTSRSLTSPHCQGHFLIQGNIPRL